MSVRHRGNVGWEACLGLWIFIHLSIFWTQSHLTTFLKVYHNTQIAKPSMSLQFNQNIQHISTVASNSSIKVAPLMQCILSFCFKCLPSFSVIRRCLCLSMFHRILSTRNILISTIVDSSFIMSGNTFKEWRDVLF